MSTEYRLAILNRAHIHIFADRYPAAQRWVRKRQGLPTAPPPLTAEQEEIRRNIGLGRQCNALEKIVAQAQRELARAIAAGKASRPVEIDIGAAEGICCPCQAKEPIVEKTKLHATKRATAGNTTDSPPPSSEVHATDISGAKDCPSTHAAGIAQAARHSTNGTQPRNADRNGATGTAGAQGGAQADPPPVKESPTPRSAWSANVAQQYASANEISGTSIPKPSTP